MNENGQRLLPLCSYHSVCITNSFFLTKTCHKVCARHTRSHHWHQLDVTVMRRAILNDVHSQFSQCRLRHRPLPGVQQGQATTKEITSLALTLATLKTPSYQSILSTPLNTVSSTLLIRVLWNYGTTPDSIYNTAMSTFGKREKQNAD